MRRAGSRTSATGLRRRPSGRRAPARSAPGNCPSPTAPFRCSPAAHAGSRPTCPRGAAVSRCRPEPAHTSSGARRVRRQRAPRRQRLPRYVERERSKCWSYASVWSPCELLYGRGWSLSAVRQNATSIRRRRRRCAAGGRVVLRVARVVGQIVRGVRVEPDRRWSPMPCRSGPAGGWPLRPCTYRPVRERRGSSCRCRPSPARVDTTDRHVYVLG